MLDRPRVLAALLITAALGANAAFLGLGAVFDYPDVLGRPATEVLASFAANRTAVSALFLVLAGAAGLLAPVAVGLARLARDGRHARLIAGLGVAAAIVQVAGLLRWPLVVPLLTDRPDTFTAVSTVLGTLLGETAGYLLTAAWTVVVVRAFRGVLLGGALALAGWSSAALITAGVLTPLGVPGADLANFAGYMLWSGWLVAVAVVLAARAPGSAAPRPLRGRMAQS